MGSVLSLFISAKMDAYDRQPPLTSQVPSW